jgi:Transposase, Mutator family
VWTRSRADLLQAVAASDLRDRAGNPLHITLHQLRRTFGTTLVNAGMSLPFLAYPVEVRKVIFSTNAVESLNARFRRATRARGHFPTEHAAMKCLGW